MAGKPEFVLHEGVAEKIAHQGPLDECILGYWGLISTPFKREKPIIKNNLNESISDRR